MEQGVTATRQLLVVDDEDNIIRAIKRLCRSQGYKIFTASSGEKALELLRHEKIGVILSDQRMPGMMGTEFFKQVKQLYPQTVRIMISGYTALDGITDAINDGAVFKFLFKPWDDDQLILHLEEAFQFYEIRNKNRQLMNELKAFNEELEQRVEEKSRDLLMQNRRLQISSELFDSLPYIVIGISEDKMVVEANRLARDSFNAGMLVGLPVDIALPESLCGLIRECCKEGPCSGKTLEITINANIFRMQCMRISTKSGIRGGLLYGEPL